MKTLNDYGIFFLTGAKIMYYNIFNIGGGVHEGHYSREHSK